LQIRQNQTNTASGIATLLYTIKITETTQNWISLGAKTGSNGSIWLYEGPGLMRISGKWVHGLIQLGIYFLCGFYCVSATKEPYNFVSRLHSPFQSVLPSTPTSHPLVSTQDTTSTRATALTFYLIW